MEYGIIILIALYLLTTSYLGLRAHYRGQASAEDYFVARRSISWIHLGLTFFATWFSTLAFLGVAGFNYKNGVSWFFAQGTFWMLAPIAAWILGRKLWVLGKCHGYITPGDLLADAYQSTIVRLLSGVICIFALIPYILVQLVGIGKVFEASTNGVISYSLGIALTATATALYTIVGGIRAIVWTDFLQGLLFLAVTVLGVYIAASAAGGLTHGLLQAHHTHPELFVVDWSEIGKPITTILIWTPGFVLLPHLWQRNYMAESERSFSRSILVFSVLSFVLLIATMLIGVLAMSLIPSVADSDTIVPVLFRDYAPAFVPLLVLATFAAGMSTIDSQLLTASSILIRDVLPPLKGGSIFENRQRLAGRVAVMLLIGLLSVLALLPESQGAIFTLASKGTAAAFLLLLPLLVALHDKNPSPILGTAMLLSGLCVLAVLEFRLIDWSLPYGFGAPITAFTAQLCSYYVLKRVKLLPRNKRLPRLPCSLLLRVPPFSFRQF